MKIRNDFVTNSSSSSYIFSDKTMIDEAFRAVQDVYREYALDILDKLVHGGIVELFPAADECHTDEQLMNVISFAAEDLDNIGYDMRMAKEMLSCPDYSSYRAAGLFANFDIVDLADHDDFYAHYVDWNFCSTDEILGWYTPALEYVRSGTEVEYTDKKGEKKTVEVRDRLRKCGMNCEECRERRYCDTPDMRELMRRINDGEITTLPEAAAFLGRFAVLSNDGQLPEFVTDRLYERTKYNCNHMG